MVNCTFPVQVRGGPYIFITFASCFLAWYNGIVNIFQDFWN